MENRRFLNRYQPQTLQVATVLLYINAVFALLDLGSLFSGNPLAIIAEVAALAGAAGAYGLANDKKWGYQLSVVCAAVSALFYLFIVASGGGFGFLLSLITRVAVVIVLVHPMSRGYVKTWFK